MKEMIQVPDGWERNNFKVLNIKLIDGDRGINYPKDDDFFEHGYCVFLSAKNVTKNGFKFNEVQFINKEKDEKLRKGKLERKDIVLTTRGTVGNIAYFDNTINYTNIRINSGMILLRNENKFLKTDYLHAFLKSSIFDKQIVNTIFGSAQPQLTVKEIEKFLIFFPKEKKEQEKIAKILSTLDKAIESTSRLIEKEKNIKTALMQELLTNGIDQNGQIRSPKTHTYKQSELGLIPDEWEVVSLGECISNNGDYGINAPAVDFSYSLPTYLRITDIDEDGHFIDCDKKSVDDLESADYFLYDGDIVFARTGNTTGKTYLYNPKDGKLVFAGFLIRFTPNSRKLIPKYLKAVTETSNYWAWVETNSARTGQPGINANEYKRFKFTLPPIEEQKQIAKILTAQDKKIQTEETNLAKLKELKKGLMNDLLNGKVRVKI